MFVLSADKNKLTVSQGEIITSGSVNVYRVKIFFDADWDGMDRMAVFRVEDEPIPAPLDDKFECKIPWECTRRNYEGEELYCGVYGMIGTDVVLPTVWVSLGEIKPGTRLGGRTVPPTPSAAEQILAQTFAERAKAESAATRAEAAAIHQPIIQNGTWWTWDPETGEYQDTGEPVSGGGAGGTGNVSSDEIAAIKVLDLAEYEEIETKSSTTLYLIRG